MTSPEISECMFTWFNSLCYIHKSFLYSTNIYCSFTVTFFKKKQAQIFVKWFHFTAIFYQTYIHISIEKGQKPIWYKINKLNNEVKKPSTHLRIHSKL